VAHAGSTASRKNLEEESRDESIHSRSSLETHIPD
jgi:hypothetical protein